jgi:hypothetical protein
MREVSPGDVVFAFVDTFITAIGVAQSYCWESPKPTEFGTTDQYGDNVGWKVLVRFTPLDHRVRPKDHMELLRPMLPAHHSPLRLVSGNRAARGRPRCHPFLLDRWHQPRWWCHGK